MLNLIIIIHISMNSLIKTSILLLVLSVLVYSYDQYCLLDSMKYRLLWAEYICSMYDYSPYYPWFESKTNSFRNFSLQN